MRCWLPRRLSLLWRRSRRSLPMPSPAWCWRRPRRRTWPTAQAQRQAAGGELRLGRRRRRGTVRLLRHPQPRAGLPEAQAGAEVPRRRRRRADWRAPAGVDAQDRRHGHRHAGGGRRGGRKARPRRRALARLPYGSVRLDGGGVRVAPSGVAQVDLFSLEPEGVARTAPLQLRAQAVPFEIPVGALQAGASYKWQAQIGAEKVTGGFSVLTASSRAMSPGASPPSRATATWQRTRSSSCWPRCTRTSA